MINEHIEIYTKKNNSGNSVIVHCINNKFFHYKTQSDRPSCRTEIEPVNLTGNVTERNSTAWLG